MRAQARPRRQTTFCSVLLQNETTVGIKTDVQERPGQNAWQWRSIPKSPTSLFPSELIVSSREMPHRSGRMKREERKEKLESRKTLVFLLSPIFSLSDLLLPLFPQPLLILTQPLPTLTSLL